MTHYRLNDKVIHIGSGEECHITEIRRHHIHDRLNDEVKVDYMIFAMSANQNLFVGPETDFRESDLATQQSLRDLEDFRQYLRNNVDPHLAPGWRHPSTSSTELIDNLKNELAAENPCIAKLAWHLVYTYTRTREDYFAEPLVKAESSKAETVKLSDGNTVSVGDRVMKITGEYHIEGTVVAIFRKADGSTPRLVVEHEAKPQGSFLHIYGPANLKALPGKVRDIPATPAILPVGARVATKYGTGTIAQVLEAHPVLPSLYRVHLDSGARVTVSSCAEGFRAVKENQE